MTLAIIAANEPRYTPLSMCLLPVLMRYATIAAITRIASNPSRTRSPNAVTNVSQSRFTGAGLGLSGDGDDSALVDSCDGAGVAGTDARIAGRGVLVSA